MFLKPNTYAVVDIETTGTNHKEDRIIQFGCVLIENGEIVTRFATDVNPNRMIPKQIQNLTGISNSRVQKAPYFEDIALTIYNLLTDTIFVAHNVYFDYKFLNFELERCGAPKLTIPGIDTVELAQIFLPTEPSFRLNALAESLGLMHDNPHQADSDAQVTAELLLVIEAKMKRLPLTTLAKIAELSHATGMETSHFIQRVLQEQKNQSQTLADSLELVDGLVIKKKAVTLFPKQYYQVAHYPKRKVAKEKLFGNQLTFRKEQARLMNLTYDFYHSSEEKNLMIEAATGMGKSLGYLLPLAFLATPEEPAVISTASILLQEQLVETEITKLNRLLEQPLQATIVKSHRHYLDLQRFKATLQAPVKQKQYALYQMATLVWLTETTTGDFDELHMTNLNHAFWQDVSHRGIEFLDKNKAFYQEDFLVFLYKKIKESNILVVNHAFLVQESRRKNPLLPESNYLLIDEAHRLPEIASKVSHQQLDTYYLRRKIEQMLEPESFFEEIKQAHVAKLDFLRLLEIYESELDGLVLAYQDFTTSLLTLYQGETSKNQEEVVVFKEAFDQLDLAGEKALGQIQLLYGEMLQLQTELLAYFEELKASWTSQELLNFGKLLNVFKQVEEQAVFFQWWSEEWSSSVIRWFVPHGKAGEVIFHLSDLNAPLIPSTIWYQRYQKILYISGSFKIGNNRNYFQNLLGIPETKLKVLPNPYDYSQQARLMIPTDSLMIQNSTNEAYATYITDVLIKLAKSQEKPILVLFTAHELLRRVYEKLRVPLLEQNREVLAQGFGGSREKILKRFYLSNDAILLGADSFWEGLDFPGDLLQVVVITRLPFENPQRPLVKARNRYLEEQGVNPFYQESVPKTALKFRQALGRLIRSKDDSGVLLVLDRRLTMAKYGKTIINALPKDLPIKEAPLTELLGEMDDFFKTGNVKTSEE